MAENGLKKMGILGGFFRWGFEEDSQTWLNFVEESDVRRMKEKKKKY